MHTHTRAHVRSHGYEEVLGSNSPSAQSETALDYE